MIVRVTVTVSMRVIVSAIVMVMVIARAALTVWVRLRVKGEGGGCMSKSSEITPFPSYPSPQVSCMGKDNFDTPQPSLSPSPLTPHSPHHSPDRTPHLKIGQQIIFGVHAQSLWKASPC